MEQSTGESVSTGWLGSPQKNVGGGGIWKGSPKGRGRGIESHGLGGGLQEHLRLCVFVGNTALLAANLLFEMLCALPKVTVV